MNISVAISYYKRGDFHLPLFYKTFESDELLLDWAKKHKDKYAYVELGIYDGLFRPLVSLHDPICDP